MCEKQSPVCPNCEGGYIIAPAYPIKLRMIVCEGCGRPRYARDRRV